MANIKKYEVKENRKFKLFKLVNKKFKWKNLAFFKGPNLQVIWWFAWKIAVPLKK